MFDRLFKRRRENIVQKLDGQRLQYVTERAEGEEIVLGKGGYANIKGEELIVCCGDNQQFKFRLDGVTASELLSRNGIILQGFDTVSQKDRTLVAYFVYHRK